MADLLSDSPVSVPPGAGRKQPLPSSNPKRNNRNRKQRPQSGFQSDVMVSESGPTAVKSPRSKKVNNAKQGPAAGTTFSQQLSSPGHPSTTKPRPVPVNENQIIGTPLKEQAYAGPTFQASPAASALPMPKFFSKSAPNGIGKPSLQGRLAGEKSPQAQIPSPEPDAIYPSAVPAREEQQSPLDVFFNADRAEREKLRSSSNGGNMIAANQASQRGGQNPGGWESMSSGKNAFLSELDGEQSDSSNPAADAPVQRPLLGGRVSSSPIVRMPTESDNADNRQAYTQSLKNLLFNTAAKSSTTPTHRSSQQDPATQSPESVYFTPSPYERVSSGPTTPQNASEQASQQSLHYGNRNLSPLFKATRAETPPRPSSLRQEGSYDATSAMHAPNPYYETTHKSPLFQNTQPSQPFQPQSWSDVETRSPTQGYYAQQTYHQTPTKMPYPTPTPMIASGGTSNAPAASASPGSGDARDVRSMEDDLRRILKLNVLS